MGLSAHNAIAIGDAENDHALLRSCEFAVAVANALPTLKEAADLVTKRDHGAGVAELIDAILEDDLASFEPRLQDITCCLERLQDGAEVQLPPYGQNVLLVGTSGSGKSTLTTGFLERLAEKKYTFCLIDPEGDYDTFGDAVSLGTPTRPPSVEEIVQLLAKSHTSCIANIVGLPIADRPGFFARRPSVLTEPYEYLVVDVPEKNMGSVMELVGNRKGELVRMDNRLGQVHLEFTIPARGLIDCARAC